MTSEQLGGLLVLIAVIFVIFNLKAIIQVVVGVALLLTRILVVLGAAVAAITSDDVVKAIIIVVIAAFLLGAISWLEDLFGIDNSSPARSEPNQNHGWEGSYPKMTCHNCNDSKSVPCNICSPGRVVRPGDPTCWKCSNTKYIRCPICS